MSGISVFNVGFHEQGIDVVYQEERDADPTGQIVVQRSIMIPAQLIQEEILELMDTIQEVVDKALIAKDNMTRRPSSSLRRNLTDAPE